MTDHVLVLGLAGPDHTAVVEEAKLLVAAGDFSSFEERDPLRTGATLGNLRPQAPSLHAKQPGLLQVRRDSTAIVALGGDARATGDGTIVDGEMVEEIYDVNDATILWRLVIRGKTFAELQVFVHMADKPMWWRRYTLQLPLASTA